MTRFVNFYEDGKIIGVADDNDSWLCENGSIVELLNEQQATIQSLKTELELVSNTKLFSRRELERKVDEQQATITALKEENDELIKHKYFVKAVEVFTDCPISETIADYSDGELFDEEEQLEFGKKMLEQEKELVEDE